MYKITCSGETRRINYLNTLYEKTGLWNLETTENDV